jgi:WD40 repeat protein/microsomal dipeptidase-like Zn-dependent dipeptidase
VILDTVEDEQPGAFELATLLSCAVVVEPELIRAVRLEAARQGRVRVDATTEALVWFSPLVRTRTPTGIAFEPEAAQVLRERLRFRWQDAQERPLLDAAWQLIAARHSATSPALVLEERLAWAVVTGEPVAVLDQALGRAMAAYVQRGEEGVAWWAAQAWDRLPPLARATPSGGMVRELGEIVAAGEPVPDPDEFLGTIDLDRLLGTVPRVRVGVRRISPSAIQLGDVSGPGAFAIEVPDTEVMRIDVTWADLAEPRSLAAHEGVVRAVAYSPDGQYLATGGDDSLRVWDAATGEPLSTDTARRGPVRALAYSRDGRLATAGDDRTIELWSKDAEPMMVLEAHRGLVNAIAFSRDGSRMVSGGQDGTVRLWEFDKVVEVLDPASDAVNAVAFSPRGRQVASAEGDGTVRLWEPGGKARTFTAHEGPVLALAFSPDGDALATAGFGGLVLWSAETLSPLRSLLTDKEPVAAVAFSPDGRRLASAGADGGARLWDVASGEVVTRFPDPVVSRSVAFSPGGQLAVAGDDGSVRIWEPERATRTEQVDLLGGQTTTVTVAPGEVQLETSIGEVFLLAETPEPPPRRREPAAAGLVDLHAFYPMHLTGQTDILASGGPKGSIGDRLRSGLLSIASSVSNLTSFSGAPRVTGDLIRAGQVGAICSVLLDPLSEMDVGASYGEPPESSYFAALLRLLDAVEADVSARHELVVVRSPEQLDEAFAGGRTALIHVVDGGFHLGATPEEIAANVEVLAERGVATVGLAHLFYRGIATGAPALPFLADRVYRTIFPQPSETGLTELGRAAVQALVANGVIVDIAYMSAAARRDTFTLLDELDSGRRVPVLASHGAYRFGKLELALDDQTVQQVAERGGVIALTLAEHPLIDGLRSKTRTRDDSIDVLTAHIDRIVNITGSWDHVAIGSDLDGFQKPTLPGLETMADLAFLQQALAARYGRPDAQRVCTGNALRLLRSGWRRQDRAAA